MEPSVVPAPCPGDRCSGGPSLVCPLPPPPPPSSEAAGALPPPAPAAPGAPAPAPSPAPPPPRRLLARVVILMRCRGASHCGELKCKSKREASKLGFQFSRIQVFKCAFSSSPPRDGTHTFRRHARVPSLNGVAHGNARCETRRWADRGCGSGWGWSERWGLGFGGGAGWAPLEHCRQGLADLARHTTKRILNPHVLS